MEELNQENRELLRAYAIVNAAPACLSRRVKFTQPGCVTTTFGKSAPDCGATVSRAPGTRWSGS